MWPQAVVTLPSYSEVSECAILFLHTLLFLFLYYYLMVYTPQLQNFPGIVVSLTKFTLKLSLLVK